MILYIQSINTLMRGISYIDRFRELLFGAKQCEESSELTSELLSRTNSRVRRVLTVTLARYRLLSVLKTLASCAKVCFHL